MHHTDAHCLFFLYPGGDGEAVAMVAGGLVEAVLFQQRMRVFVCEYLVHQQTCRLVFIILAI